MLKENFQICPHCGKGEMQDESAVIDVNIPDTGDRIVLICNVCRHRIVNMMFSKNDINVSDNVNVEKIAADKK